MDRTGGLSAIGNTPVVRLARMADDGCAEVWVKMEAANPTGSYKDRMALAMIEAAEADGRLRPGQLVVEYTGGSTGSSLAFVCAVKGYPLRIVSSDAFAEEKIRTMRAFGAEVELIPSPDGITPDLIPSMMRRAAEIAAQTGAFATDQFNNTDMVEGYRRLGEELLDQLPGPAADQRVLQLRRDRGLLPRRQPRAGRRAARAPPGRRRARRIGRALGRAARHPPHRGRRHRPAPAAATPADYNEVIAIPEARAFQLARQAARDGGHLLRAVDRREPRRGPGYRPPVRARPSRGHRPGRQRPEIPQRPALLVAVRQRSRKWR